MQPRGNQSCFSKCGLGARGHRSPTPDLLSRNVHFSKIPTGCVCTFKVEKHSTNGNQSEGEENTGFSLPLSQNSQAFMGKKKKLFSGSMADSQGRF